MGFNAAGYVIIFMIHVFIHHNLPAICKLSIYNSCIIIGMIFLVTGNLGFADHFSLQGNGSGREGHDENRRVRSNNSHLEATAFFRGMVRKLQRFYKFLKYL